MKKPVVAILGRPNVGKSTLFNRIIRKREAIVDDSPGVTRDRLYYTTEWAGREFKLIDTGGYIPNSEDVFDRAIRQQIEFAAAEASVIVFLTDVTTGVTPLDQDMAQYLKKSGRDIVLVVNKVDNEMREADLADFYQLGLGEPVPVSALGGRSVGDFLDIVSSYFPDTQIAGEEDDSQIKLAVVGRPNVGKSSFVNAIVGQEKLIVTDIPGTTRDAIDTRIKYKEKSIVLIDTAGLRKRSKVKENIEYFSNVRTFNAIQRSDITLILIDAQEGLTDQDKKIIESAADEGKGIVLVVNKWDLLEKETNTARNIEQDMKQDIRHLAYVPILFISALTRQRVFKPLDVAIAVAGERSRKLQTAELNRFLQNIVIKNHPPAFGDKWIKLNYMTQIKTRPPRFAIFTNEPKGIKRNYLNYVENQMREQFGFLGVPIKIHTRKK